MSEKQVRGIRLGGIAPRSAAQVFVVNRFLTTLAVLTHRTLLVLTAPLYTMLVLCLWPLDALRGRHRFPTFASTKWRLSWRRGQPRRN